MWVCALETSSAAGEVALLSPEDRCLSLQLGVASAHARDLFPTLERLLAEAGVGRRDLDLLVVDVGPGSYTGIRVGVTAAKMLALALDRPVVPVDSLEILGCNAREGGACVVAAPVLDAKLGHVYGAAFRTTSPLERLCADFVGTPEALAGQLPPEAVVYGDGVARYGEMFAAFAAGDPGWARPRAETAARLGKASFAAGGAVDPCTLTPAYLRVSEAERKRMEKERYAP